MATPMTVQMQISESFSYFTTTEPSVLESQYDMVSLWSPAPTFCTMQLLTMYLKYGAIARSFSMILLPIASDHSDAFPGTNFFDSST